MKKIESHGGQIITGFCKQLVEQAPAYGKFNGVELRCEPGTTVEELEELFHAETERQQKQYKASIRGRVHTQSSSHHTRAYQASADALIGALDTVDCDDPAAVLAWFIVFGARVDTSRVRYNRGALVAWWAERGWLAGVNTGSEYDENDRDNTLRYIIGQALDCIEHFGAPHPMIERFADAWIERWGSEQ